MVMTNTSRNSSETVETLDQSPDIAEDLTLSADDINNAEPDSQSVDQDAPGATLDPTLIQAVADRPLKGRSSNQVLPKSTGQRAFGIANRMAKATTLENLYQITVTELRKRFQCDRAFVYCFQSQSDGNIIAESLTSGYTPTLGENLSVMAFGAATIKDYQTQSSIALNEAKEEAISPHQAQLLQRFQVQASLSLPIFIADQLWGLLVVQQCNGARNWKESETGLLYQDSTELTLKIQSYNLHQQAQKEIERGLALATITKNVREFNDLERIFESTARSLRNFLKVDRVAVFQFAPGSHHSRGEVTVESVNPSYVSAKEVLIEDHCFSTQLAESYRMGRVSKVDDIYAPGSLAECHVEILAQFQVQANLVVPLLKDNQLWGLFCIHQCSGPRRWQTVEMAFVQRVAAQLDLAMQQADYFNQVQAKTRQLEEAFEKEQLIAKITERLRITTNLPKTLQATVRDIRELMAADRVGLYQFDVARNYSVGEFVAEDTSPGTLSVMAAKIEDHCFAEDQAENYRKGRDWVVNDVQALDIPDCLVELLAQMQVKASIVVPLMQGPILWGLFAVHQCKGPREWQKEDIQFAHRIGAQLNLALRQEHYLNQVQEKTAKLTETADREKASKEQLQQQVITLLQAVGPALEGDLTARAPVTETEVGTVASAYNSTLQSLQKIVLQVQAAANQVGDASKSSETSSVAVNQQAEQQAKSLEQALILIQKMMNSTEAVAQDAQQVEAAAQQANRIVQRGDTAMNQTVDGIMAIRATVAETNQRIKRLSESSQKVSKIVSLISHFTTQTQLLALNASIEATRAGQYGRGFSVVADEVRSLARQSAAATTEIEQFVQEIQMSTAEVSTAMETGIQQVAAGTDMVTDARQNLTAIVEATDQIRLLIADITRATHKQADEFKVVTQTMSEATAIANQTSENSNQLTHSIQQVLETAAALQSSAGKFKVK